MKKNVFYISVLGFAILVSACALKIGVDKFDLDAKSTQNQKPRSTPPDLPAVFKGL